MKNQIDRHHREVEFQVGELVYLKLKPYRFWSLAKKVNGKLSPRFYRPYEISEKIGKVTYRLNLPPTARIYNVFHISQLKRALKATTVSQPLPKGSTEEMELQVEPEEVKDMCRTKEGELQLLFKWKNLPDHENTWENVADIQI